MRLFALVLVVSLLAVLILQQLSGSRSAELSGYPDESAHYVTGLMLRSYVLDGGWVTSPVSFAERYYVHYPKVAIGHWPPLYYLVQLLWTTVFPATIGSLLYLQAVLLAAISALLFSIVQSRFGWLSATVLCGVFLVLPPTQELASEIMAEPLLALMTLVATVAIALYFETGRWAHLIGFVILVEMAVHTKGSGLALIGIPSLVALCLRRFDEFRKPVFWLAHLGMVALIVPWQFLTWKMVSNGMEGPVGLALFAAQSRTFGEILVGTFGWLLLGAILCGGFLVVRSRRFLDPLMVSCAVAAALTVVFHSAAPNGAEARRLFMAIPGSLVLAAVPVWHLLRARDFQVWAPGVLLALVLLSLLPSWTLFRKVSVGYRAVSSWLLGHSGGEGVILVSSDIDGEGMLISEIGQSQPRPSLYVVRSSKLLINCDWLGRDCSQTVTDPVAVQKALDEIPVRAVVVDTFSGIASRPDTDLVRRTVAERPDLWALRKTVSATAPQPGRPGEIRVYERLGLTRPEEVRVQVDLRRMIGRVIRN